jgi:hypothetical protein
MFGKLFLTISLLVLAACAKPNWAPTRSLDPISQSEEAACSLKFSKSGVCIYWKWEKHPNESDVGSFVFKTYTIDEDGSMNAADIQDDMNVELWMPDMSHGSSPVEVSKTAVGTYRADEVFFIMPGKWEIKFQIKKSGVIQDEAVSVIHF